MAANVPSVIKRLDKLPSLKEYIRDTMKKYKVRSIDAINAVKKGLAIAKRRSLDLPLDIFYQLVEKALSSCLKSEDGGKSLDTKCFEKEFWVLLEQPLKESTKTVASKELNSKLDELHQLLVDYCLRLGDKKLINEFFSYLEQWLKSIREEVDVWLRIRESVLKERIDYAKIVKEMRSLRG